MYKYHVIEGLLKTSSVVSTGRNIWNISMTQEDLCTFDTSRPSCDNPPTITVCRAQGASSAPFHCRVQFWLDNYETRIDTIGGRIGESKYLLTKVP